MATTSFVEIFRRKWSSSAMIITIISTPPPKNKTPANFQQNPKKTPTRISQNKTASGFMGKINTPKMRVQMPKIWCFLYFFLIFAHSVCVKISILETFFFARYQNLPPFGPIVGLSFFRSNPPKSDPPPDIQQRTQKILTNITQKKKMPGVSFWGQSCHSNRPHWRIQQLQLQRYVAFECTGGGSDTTTQSHQTLTHQQCWAGGSGRLRLRQLGTAAATLRERRVPPSRTPPQRSPASEQT